MRDNSGVPITCPTINRVRDILESLEFDENEQHLSEDVQNALGYLEEVRKANEELRAWGNDQYESAISWESTSDEWQSKAEASEAKLDDLQTEYDALDEAFDAVKSEFSDMQDDYLNLQEDYDNLKSEQQ